MAGLRPQEELDRLAAVYELGKLDTPAEERYDRFTREVARLLDVPMAYLALLDAERQWLKSSVGPMQCEMARSQSFCTHTIGEPEPLIIRDAREDPRFATSSLVVSEPWVRFYAGVPLAGPGGHRVGTFCVADTQPRELDTEELAILRRFASMVEEKLNEAPRVFLSYSHRDEAWKDRLMRHLTVLEEQRLVELWEDRRIEAGGAWERQIEEAIEASNVAVLLVTASYLTSRFILDVEIPRLIERRDREGIQIFPIIVEPCCWDRVDWLARLNLRPRDGKALAAAGSDQVEALLAALSGEILESCSLPDARRSAAEPVRRPDPVSAAAASPARAVPPLPAVPAPVSAPEPDGVPDAPAQGIDSIIVLPFADLSAGRDQEFLCDGVVDELINALTPIEGLRVASQLSTFQFKSGELELDRVPQRMGVGSALQGSVRRDGERLRISVRLIRLDGGFNLWSERFEGTVDDVWGLQDEVAAGVGTALRGTLSAGARAVPGRRGPDDREAYELYLKARHHWNRRTEASLRTSLGHFRQAVTRDPRYARAHAGLAQAYITLSTYGALAPDDAMPAARKAAARALEIDPGLSEAHSALGVVEALYDHAWEAAEARFRRALAAGPEDPAPRHWYAVNFLLPAGRFEEAHRELETVIELDPLSLTARTSAGMQLYFEGRFDRAVVRFQEVLELDAGFPMAHLFLGQTLAELGRFDQAVDHIETAMERSGGGSPETQAALAYALGRSGDAEGARSLLLDLSSQAAERYVSPGLQAQVLMGLGEHEPALGWLEKAAEARASDLAWLRVRPVFRPLASEPRFQALVVRLGLAGASGQATERAGAAGSPAGSGW